jgi:hypothetical protein
MNEYKIVLKNGTELFLESVMDVISIDNILNNSEKFVQFHGKFIIRKKRISHIVKIS